MTPKNTGASPRCEAKNRLATRAFSDRPIDDALTPVDRRRSLTRLSVAVRDARIRLARNDIYDALGPVSRHSEAALLCLELDDDEGLKHHLRRVVEGVRKAGQKHKELGGLLSEPWPVTSEAVA